VSALEERENLPG